MDKKKIYKDYTTIDKEESHITNQEKNRFIKEIKNYLGEDIKQHFKQEPKKLTLLDKIKLMFR
jgi:hypothetical protein